jgi:hypothetical protein
VSNEISAKSDVNRAMQENIKNVITEIWEDIMKNGITDVSEDILDRCNTLEKNTIKSWNKLCVEDNEYYLATFDSINDRYSRVEDDSVCDENLNETCYVIKNWAPLTNSLVSVKDLDFYVSSYEVNKVSIRIVLRPTIKSWVKWGFVANDELILQTTISQRPF